MIHALSRRTAAAAASAALLAGGLGIALAPAAHAATGPLGGFYECFGSHPNAASQPNNPAYVGVPCKGVGTIDVTVTFIDQTTGTKTQVTCASAKPVGNNMMVVFTGCSGDTATL